MRNGKKGFTIIEVVIVLAIAGLIFAIVFWALPNLQKNQRDGDRRQVVGNLVANLDQYAANSNGNYPELASTEYTWAGFFDTFYDCVFTDGAKLTDVSGKTCQMSDSLEGAFLVDVFADGTGPATMASSDAIGTMRVQEGGQCAAIGSTTNGNGDRALAVIVRLENGTAYCLDNN